MVSQGEKFDNDSELNYFSYDEDSNTITIYEDAAMTMVVEGDGAPDSLDVNGNTISFSMLYADMGEDAPAGLEITFSFTKSA